MSSYNSSAQAGTPQIFSAVDNISGLPLAGGLLFTYASGTLTPQATYTDNTLTTQCANPIILDNYGQAIFWLGPENYRFNLLNSLGVQQAHYPMDNIQPVSVVTLSTQLAGTTTTSQGQGLVGFNSTLSYPLETLPGALASAATGQGDALVAVKSDITGSVARTQHSKNAETISLLDFPLVDPTGVSDSTAGINTAIQMCSNCELLIPVGTYKITGTITLKSGVSLRGYGMDSILMPTGGTWTQAILYGVSLVNTNLRDFKLDSTNVTPLTANGMYINGITDSEVSGLYLLNSQNFGMITFSAVRCKYLRNTINTTYKWDGMTLSTGSTDNVIEGNIVLNSYDSGIGFTDTVGTVCVGNYVRRSQIGGNWFAPGIDASGAQNATISGNYVLGNQFGISLLVHPNSGQWPKRVSVVGNTIADGSYGIMLGWVYLNGVTFNGYTVGNVLYLTSAATGAFALGQFLFLGNTEQSTINTQISGTLGALGSSYGLAGPLANGAQFAAHFSGLNMTLDSNVAVGAIANGQMITAASVVGSPTVVGLSSGTAGQAGAVYTISVSQSTIATESVATFGNIGSSGSPVAFTSGAYVGALQEINITGNTIFDQQFAGIHVDAAVDDILISENVITYCTGADGIQLVGSNGVTISGNVCGHNGNGINLNTGSTNISQFANVCTSNSGNNYTGTVATGFSTVAVETDGVWGPSFVSLTYSGSNTSSYKYKVVGNITFWSAQINFSGNSSSTNPNTTMTLPSVAASNGTCSAANASTGATLGNGYVYSNTAYLPTWSGLASVIVTGWYFNS